MKYYTPAVLGVAALLAFISIMSSGQPGPADWLIDWTDWAIKIIGIAFGGQALGYGAKWLLNRA